MHQRTPASSQKPGSLNRVYCVSSSRTSHNDTKKPHTKRPHPYMIKGIENNVKWKKKSAGFKNLHILLLRTRRKEFIEKKKYWK